MALLSTATTEPLSLGHQPVLKRFTCSQRVRIYEPSMPTAHTQGCNLQPRDAASLQLFCLRHELTHQCALPTVYVQGSGVGRVGEGDVHGADAATERHGSVPRRADPAAGESEERPGGHGEAGVPAGLHLPVAAEEGRAPHQVQRRHLRRGLHPLVHRRTPGHLERPVLRRPHRPVLITVLSLV
uniref:Uncharacterized protein n=1 Tax=Arundo donax TaxID=35708 RepID=A0A0A9G563_ARUDO